MSPKIQQPFFSDSKCFQKINKKRGLQPKFYIISELFFTNSVTPKNNGIWSGSSLFEYPLCNYLNTTIFMRHVTVCPVAKSYIIFRLPVDFCKMQFGIGLYRKHHMQVRTAC